MMHTRLLAQAASCALHLSLAALAQSLIPVSYDGVYDDQSASLATVACSSALEALGYTTLGSLPVFPYTGGASAVPPDGSAGCGTCWELWYSGNRITVLAVDYTSEGFNIAEEAFDVLTNGRARYLGRMNATAVQVDPSACGL